MYKIKSLNTGHTFTVKQKPLKINGEYFYPLIEGDKALLNDVKNVLKNCDMKYRTQKVNHNFGSLYVNTGDDEFWFMNGVHSDITMKNIGLNKFLNKLLENMDVSYSGNGKDTELYEKIQLSIMRLYFK